MFRANIWNLGYDGQYLLGAALITGVAPHMGGVPVWLGLVALFALSMAAGAAWTIIPAILKARYQTNEIITTLMMSFIGIGLANILIKGPFQDPTVNIPQTRVIDPSRMLPSIPGTHIHVGVLIALGRRADRLLRAHAHLVRPAPARARREPARGGARRVSTCAG